jgi:cytochrome c biogenesis protein CcmG/thiol:disulfide interchange protein DsbE
MSAALSLPGRLRRLRRSTKIAYGVGIAVLVAIAVVVATTGAGGHRTPPPLAKTFTLTEVGDPGHQVSLAAYQGRPVIINFFASWCTPCKAETPLIAKFYAANKGKVAIIGIDANDEASPALKFMKAAGVRYPVGSDPYPSETSTSYGVLALPQTFFLDPQHRIVKHVVGAVTKRELTAGVSLMDRG